MVYENRKAGLERARAAAFVIALTLGSPVWSQSTALTVTLTGQSMIRSDIRATTPAAGAPATGEQAGYILERLAEYSRPFGTTIQVKGETAESSN
jgi:hypothetical protein